MKALLKADDDGQIPELQFLCKMLTKNDLVDENILSAFRQQFKVLDKDGSGALDSKVCPDLTHCSGRDDANHTIYALGDLKNAHL